METHKYTNAHSYMHTYTYKDKKIAYIHTYEGIQSYMYKT